MVLSIMLAVIVMIAKMLVIIIQCNSHLVMCQLNSTKDNYKTSTK